jgi:hypothetical protein
MCLAAEKGECGGQLRVVTCAPAEQLQQWDVELHSTPPVPPPPTPKPAPTTAEVFASSATEQIFGFGEHQQGRLDNKNASYDMEQCLEYGHSYACLFVCVNAWGVANRTPSPLLVAGTLSFRWFGDTFTSLDCATALYCRHGGEVCLPWVVVANNGELEYGMLYVVMFLVNGPTPATSHGFEAPPFCSLSC